MAVLILCRELQFQGFPHRKDVKQSLSFGKLHLLTEVMVELFLGPQQHTNRKIYHCAKSQNCGHMLLSHWLSKIERIQVPYYQYCLLY